MARCATALPTRAAASTVEPDPDLRKSASSEDAAAIVRPASSLEAEFRKSGSGATVDAAKRVGKTVAQRAKQAGITKVVYDRGGFLYHGRIAAAAQAAREEGLEF